MKKIIIVGLGPAGLEHITLKTWEIIGQAERLYLRTGVHPAAEELMAKGIKFQSFDHLYEQEEDFESIYQKIVDLLIAEVEQDNKGLIVYGVPGHPLVAEETVQHLLRQAAQKGVKTEVIAGMSFLDTTIAMLGIDPAAGLLVVDALTIQREELNPGQHIIFTQVYNRLVASDLKLLLLDIYPPEHQAIIIKNAGLKDMEQQIKVPLAEMDHQEYFDHLTSVYLQPCEAINRPASPYGVEPLIEVMKKLLSPEGCPWDREQDHQSLRPHLIEEAYEVIEAIDCGEMDKLEEELGDLLFQIVFHSVLAENSGSFSFANVVDGITQKMVRRHPHVFGDISVENSQEVLQNWDKIKAVEQGYKGEAIPRVMTKINRSLPALLLAEEVQKKAAKVGFDWDELEGAWDKVEEELVELKEAIAENNCLNNSQNNKDRIEEEMGDLLFALVNVCRFLKISAELALEKASRKFISRFNYIEDKLQQNGAKWEEMDLDSLENIWKEAKKAIN
ncbi:MAG: nucleoside triphosphate pyrophosphohydrolase [Peptococcia bacterium]